MAVFTSLSTAHLFSCLFVIFLAHCSNCYPHKRDLSNFPEVINILEDGRDRQLKQTQILQNISTAFRQGGSNILQEQSGSMATMITALANQSEMLASISESLNTLVSVNLDLLALNQSKNLNNISNSLDKLTKISPVTARDCYDIASQGPYMSGPYTISTWDGQSPFKVYCDMESDEDNGWIVLQRRFDGSVDFDRGWKEYKNGFGDLEGEFWLGLNKMYRLTRTGGPWKLRVELEDFENNTVYAEYNNFAIGSEKTNFQLVSVGQYDGTAGDSIAFHVGNGFSTKDRDNESNSWRSCAVEYGAWWHTPTCGFRSNFGGVYRTSELAELNGIHWVDFKNGKTLKSATMKIKSNR